MNHKQLLALFLCFVMILSSKIVSIEKEKIVEVKNVNNNLDEYYIENEREENINIFYPVTKYENVNNEIVKKIEEYKNNVMNSDYSSEKKELLISFDSFKKGNINSFKFNVKSKVGLTHDINEVFTIVYKEDQIIDMKFLEGLSSEFVDEIFKELTERVKENSKVKEYANDNWLKNLSRENFLSNFILDKENIVIIFNPGTIAPSVAGIIEIEVPYKILDFDIE